jgi:hypothetical protein
MAGIGFLTVVSELIKKLVSGRDVRTKAIKALADRKFEEIEATNKLFVRLLTELNDATRECHMEIRSGTLSKASISRFEAVVRQVVETREEGRVLRRSEYAEARAFRDDFKETGILTKLPPEVSRQLSKFMDRYVGFFTMDGQYRHELDHATRSAKEIVFDLRAARKASKSENASELGKIKNQLTSLLDATNGYLDKSLLRWPEIAGEYHKLAKLFAEHDLA